MSNVIVVVGPGLIGQAIARRVGVGKHVLLADLRRTTRPPRPRSWATPSPAATS